MDRRSGSASALPRRGNHGVTSRHCGLSKVAIPSRHHEVGVVDRRGRRKVDGVVAAEPMALGELARGSSERVVKPDPLELLTELVDRPDRGSQRSRIDPSRAASRGRGGARLGVDQLAGCDGRRSVPQLRGDIGSRLVEHELDQGGRVEVDDQRRCSATRPDTGADDESRLRPSTLRLGRWARARALALGDLRADRRVPRGRAARHACPASSR